MYHLFAKPAETTHLVDGRVCGEAVQVAVPVHVPHVHALPLAQHHRERVVVVRAVLVLLVLVLVLCELNQVREEDGGELSLHLDRWAGQQYTMHGGTFSHAPPTA